MSFVHVLIFFCHPLSNDFSLVLLYIIICYKINAHYTDNREVKPRPLNVYITLLLIIITIIGSVQNVRQEGIGASHV